MQQPDEDWDIPPRLPLAHEENVNECAGRLLPHAVWQKASDCVAGLVQRAYRPQGTEYRCEENALHDLRACEIARLPADALPQPEYAPV